MPIMYRCSDGTKVSDATIKKRLSDAYREKYWQGHPSCDGCGDRAEGSAHLIPKARLKQLGLSDKIYHPDFFVPACHSCNLILENITSEEVKTLMCYEKLLKLMKTYDPERYSKMQIL